jgi:hypothetical protein
MDKTWKKYFDTHEALAQGMELLDRFNNLPDNNYDAYDLFLANLDKYDESLLDKASDMRSEINKRDKEKDEKIELLKGLLDARSGITSSKPIYTELQDPKLSILIEKWLIFKSAKNLKESSIDSLRQRTALPVVTHSIKLLSLIEY